MFSLIEPIAEVLTRAPRDEPDPRPRNRHGSPPITPSAARLRSGASGNRRPGPRSRPPSRRGRSGRHRGGGSPHRARRGDRPRLRPPGTRGRSGPRGRGAEACAGASHACQRRIARDVGPVIVEELGLDPVLARTAEERELVRPEVGVVGAGVGVAAQMPLTGRRERQEVLPQGRLVGLPVGPEGATLVPQGAEPVLVGDRVLDDQGPDAIGVREREPEADRAPVILQVEVVAPQPERGGEAVDRLGQMVEGIGEGFGVWRGAVSEPDEVGRDQVIRAASRLSSGSYMRDDEGNPCSSNRVGPSRGPASRRRSFGRRPRRSGRRLRASRRPFPPHGSTPTRSSLRATAPGLRTPPALRSA